MKIIKYRLATEINHGTPEEPDIETVLSGVTMPYTDANYAIAQAEGRSLWDVVSHARDWPELQKAAPRLSQFAELMAELRKLSGEMELPDFYEELVQRTGYAVMLEQKNTVEDRTRLENVHEVLSSIQNYLENAVDEPSLAGFLDEIALYTDLDSHDPSEDCVVMMTMHSAKGLEFPIVILADLDHAFSRQDFDTPVLVHPDMGLGPKRIDLERKIQYPTLARLAIQEKLRRENLAEEQRILYVAMTRPKEKLILVDALYNATGRLQKLAAVAACPVLPETVAEGRTLGDWVLLPLLCRPEAAPLRAMAETEIDQLYIGEDRSWQVFLHDSEDYRERPARPQATAEETGETALFDPELLSFIYPYQRETALPAKVTATQLKGRPADQEIAEYAAHTPYLRPLSQPNFRRERQGLTPAERGTATHLVLQYLDFSNVDVAGQIEALRQRSLLTDQQAAAVETAPLERFLPPPPCLVY